MTVHIILIVIQMRQAIEVFADNETGHIASYNFTTYFVSKLLVTVAVFTVIFGYIFTYK